MFEPLDNVPTEWPSPGRGQLLGKLKREHWRRLMTDFAKFVKVSVEDMENKLTPDEMLDAWLAQTYDKPKRAE